MGETIMNPMRVHDMLSNYNRLERLLENYAETELLDVEKDDYLESLEIEGEYVEFQVRHRDGVGSVVFIDHNTIVDWAEDRQGGSNAEASV
jgi:hypothetical protein